MFVNHPHTINYPYKVFHSSDSDHQNLNGHLLFWVVGFSSVTPLGLYLELPVNINDQLYKQRLAYSQRPLERRLHVNCAGAERLISEVSDFTEKCSYLSQTEGALCVCNIKNVTVISGPFISAIKKQETTVLS